MVHKGKLFPKRPYLKSLYQTHLDKHDNCFQEEGLMMVGKNDEWEERTECEIQVIF